MSEKLIYLIVTVIFVIGVFIFWQYILNVYEVKFEISPQKLYADNESEVIIKAVPVNSLGLKIPFRTAEITYSIEYGKNLIEIEEMLQNGILKLKAKNQKGIVTLIVESNYSLMPTKIEIIVDSNFT